MSSLFDVATFSLLHAGLGVGRLIQIGLTERMTKITRICVTIDSINHAVLKTATSPHPMLVATSLGALAAALILALTPIGHVFGFVPLQPLVLTAIAVIAVGYLAMAEGLKRVAMPSRSGAHRRASAPIITGR